ncbi:MAG: putative sulfate exporter family transporter [Myxococcota bacterium]
MVASAPRPLPSTNPYLNPELSRFVGSMEGVPEWTDPAETAEERAERTGWRARGHSLLEMTGQLLPGLALAFALALFAREVSIWLGARAFGLERSPVSPILIAILTGLLVRNTVGLPRVYELGLQLSLKRLLRVGVALLGIRLSLGAVGAIGLVALPIVASCILTALVLVTWISRLLHLPPRLGTLVAVGTAICGNTAIVATGPVIHADEDEISYAVGTITVFGLLALMSYPFLSHGIFGGDPQLAGLFLGTAIHDTAQVAGAGLLYLQQYGAPEALDTATVTKLLRNLFMVGVIPLMALYYHRADEERAKTKKPSLGQMVPLFVFGFLALVLVRTVGDLGDTPFGGLLTTASWENTIRGMSGASAWCLTVAMAAVGLGTNLRQLRTLGLKPLGVGLAAALTVGLVSAALIRGLAPYMAGSMR